MFCSNTYTNEARIRAGEITETRVDERFTLYKGPLHRVQTTSTLLGLQAGSRQQVTAESTRETSSLLGESSRQVEQRTVLVDGLPRPHSLDHITGTRGLDPIPTSQQLRLSAEVGAINASGGAVTGMSVGLGVAKVGGSKLLFGALVGGGLGLALVGGSAAFLQWRHISATRYERQYIGDVDTWLTLANENGWTVPVVEELATLWQQAVKGTPMCKLLYDDVIQYIREFVVEGEHPPLLASMLRFPPLSPRPRPQAC